jgi:hypothetical protein
MAELKAKKYGGENPLKALEILGCEKYAMAKITQVNKVIIIFNTDIIQYYHYLIVPCC